MKMMGFAWDDAGAGGLVPDTESYGCAYGEKLTVSARAPETQPANGYAQPLNRHRFFHMRSQSCKNCRFWPFKNENESYGGPNALGTILYFAPEMLLNEEPSHRPTDIDAMGLICWEMLSGKLIWYNPDRFPLKPVQLISKYSRQERPSLDELPQGLDPAVIVLIQDCWAEDHAQRPSADELWRRISALDPNNPEHNNRWNCILMISLLRAILLKIACVLQCPQTCSI